MVDDHSLRRHHNWYHHSLWNVTSGKIIGEMHQTPLGGFHWKKDPTDDHDDWFPEKMGEILGRTEYFADVMSLGPPDGLFMTSMQKALKQIADRKTKKTVRVRMMFGNIVGMPVNCNKVMEELTKGLPTDANLQVWVGAWRKGVSWNHAKIVAVDGIYLHTGGHNMWDYHYLKNNPVHDLSFEIEGKIASDGHLYANEQWSFIENKQSTLGGFCVDKLPDCMELPVPIRVTVTEWPAGKAPIFPPKYKKSLHPQRTRQEGDVPMISIGRYGSLLRSDRPSDDAIWAMLGSAQTIIRLAIQDLGPVCIPKTKIPLPGCVWPKETMTVLGRVIWERGVDVEIILSNPGSIPGGLALTEACYGNGWTCVDVAAEIIKTIRTNYPEADDAALRKKVAENLRVSYIRHKSGNKYDDGKTVGMHAKHFIVDDICSYTGSQNLYICDLGEWGVVVDHEAETQKIKEEYWDPMWKVSYDPTDCDVDAVMDGLDIDRDPKEEATGLVYQNANLKPHKTEFYDDTDTVEV
jgi:phosphatidylserine/phosphatidylglycerophosphate/cardiolipin synthase-like enzyme